MIVNAAQQVLHERLLAGVVRQVHQLAKVGLELLLARHTLPELLNEVLQNDRPLVLVGSVREVLR